MKNVEALKKLYQSITGSLYEVADETTIAGCIDKIADAMGEAIEAIVDPYEVTITQEGDDSYTADCSFGDIMDAYGLGRHIVATMEFGGITGTAELQAVYQQSVAFCADDFLHNLHLVAIVGVSGDDPYVNVAAYTLTPAE